MDDQTFAALAHAYRRDVLLALSARDPGAPALDAVDAVADDHVDPESVRLALYHTHLPTLAAAGLIEWDREDLAVSRGPAFDAVEPVLELLAEDLEPRRLPV